MMPPERKKVFEEFLAAAKGTGSPPNPAMLLLIEALPIAKYLAKYITSVFTININRKRLKTINEKREALDALSKQIIAERRSDPNGDHKDLLGLLTTATEDGQCI
jgi:hypothetical protein